MSTTPALPDRNARLRAIATNPVGAARFFHKVVDLFTSKILRVGQDRPGLFGPTEAYYGTVEEQGRKTLHLHSLLWIKGSLSPQEIRDRLLSDVSFEHDLVRWLEQCHRGDYMLESGEQLAERLEEQYLQKSADGDLIPKSRIRPGLRDPVLELPVRPPPDDSNSDLQNWHDQFSRDVDEIIFRSNRHDAFHGKGCWKGTRDKGYCKARFPRECFPETQLDRSSGALRFKKTEQWINTFNPHLSYVLRSNSDVTCLLSGTQIKAVIAYVTDYVTKTTLNTNTFFQTVRAV
ncbi:hypothetical protein K466DRAFT_501813, partial [Polyporus arcularius HHB13444]